MTNIGILGKRNKDGEMKFITAIADSQRTDMGNETTEEHLKIHLVGKNRDILLLGTGAARVIMETAKVLRATEGIDTVEDAIKAVLDVTHDQYSEMTKGKHEKLIKNEFDVNFLVGGPGRKELLMMAVNTTGFRGSVKHDTYAGRGASAIEVKPGDWNGKFDGSAGRHIGRYIDGQRESGRPITIDTVADGLIEQHDLSLRGAKDLGVDDKLHYGIVVPGRTVRLVHPRAQISDVDAVIEQMVNLTGMDVGDVLKGLEDVTDPVKNSKAVDLFSEVAGFASSVYYALVSELYNSSNLKKEYTGLSESLYRNPEFGARFNEIGKRRVASLGRVQEGVEAILSGSAKRMGAYAAAASERGRVANEELLAKYNGKENVNEEPKD